jgi:acetyl-CoA carboxylase biotin carboxyl carrier protein
LLIVPSRRYNLVPFEEDELEIERLREIVKLLKDEDLTEITVAEGDARITVRRDAPREVPVASQLASVEAAPVAVSEIPSGTASITAPLVGTFYRRATPDADPFVEPGDIVQPGDVVCVIEAMKVMNEIKAETAGRIRSVLADDGAPVEYGQILFVLDPL